MRILSILRQSDHRRMPWKNGGGVTVEIAVLPEGAGLANFAWRVSMATVASDGPFSDFPGVDRTLSILDGEGMKLFIEGWEPLLLTQDSNPLFFAADAATTATLVAGPITDLNVMTRRGSASHRVDRLNVKGTLEVALEAGTLLLLCASGSVKATISGEEACLDKLDCLVLAPRSDHALQLSGAALCYAIRITEFLGRRRFPVGSFCLDKRKTPCVSVLS